MFDNSAGKNSNLNKTRREISDDVFYFIADVAKKLTGAHLPKNEKNLLLIKNRMSKIITKYKLAGHDELCEYIKANINTESFRNDFISAVTTHKTEFYREEFHIEYLTSQVLELVKSRDTIYIWSAACSTGAEPYTIAIHLAKSLSEADFKKIQILATDVDPISVQDAINGEYVEDDLYGLNKSDITTYFKKSNNVYTVKESIKNKIYFSVLNLMDDQYKIKKTFDFILCRNVLMYFDTIDRNKIFKNLTQYCSPKGAIMLGISEVGIVDTRDYKLHKNSIYLKVG